MNKKQFLRALSQVYTRLGVTGHGVGVIAIRHIPQGTDPFLHADPHGSVLRITEHELKSAVAPEEAKLLVKDFCALQDGVYYVPDYGIDALTKFYYLNHSSEPNMTTPDKGETFITMRDIQRGEELTVDYGEYHESTHFQKTKQPRKRL
jgi:SET domain-containing protein